MAVEYIWTFIIKWPNNVMVRGFCGGLKCENWLVVLKSTVWIEQNVIATVQLVTCNIKKVVSVHRCVWSKNGF